MVIVFLESKCLFLNIYLMHASHILQIHFGAIVSLCNVFDFSDCFVSGSKPGHFRDYVCVYSAFRE